MRLWHFDLIPVLPRQQLLSQWRECVCIAKNLAEKGTPNHILVNRILDYPSQHFMIYSDIVQSEMRKRGYKINESSLIRFNDYFIKWVNNRTFPKKENKNVLFYDWHNEKYLLQCYRNLEEKHDCGAISDKEFNIIVQATLRLLKIFSIKNNKKKGGLN